jgi:hypothetical protein
MARFDDLPVEVLVKIFSHLKKGEIIYTTRNVCTHWRKVSEHYKLWTGWMFFPSLTMTENYIIDILKSMPALRQFAFLGKCNVLKGLSEYCTKSGVICVPFIDISADVLHLIMERLPKISDLRITVNPTPEGLEISSIIGKSDTLICLELRSSGQEEVMEGLLMPIADGCPNLINLRCQISTTVRVNTVT